MKRAEQVYREILCLNMEMGRKAVTQKELSINLGISLSTVNHALKPLRSMGAIEVKNRNFSVTNPKKILLYWASVRNLEKDIIYETRVEKTALQIEKNMPPGIVFTSYSGFKLKYNEVAADYSEVYVYAPDINELKKRFPKSMNKPNLTVLRKDSNMKQLTIANLFVDLWNMREWYAKEFVQSMEEKWNTGMTC